MNAAEKGDVDVVAALLERPNIDVNVPGPEERTALSWAARRGRTQGEITF